MWMGLLRIVVGWICAPVGKQRGVGDVKAGRKRMKRRTRELRRRRECLKTSKKIG